MSASSATWAKPQSSRSSRYLCPGRCCSFRPTADPPALVAALFGITNYLYMFTPAIAVLIMLLIVTRDGYSKGGWKTLGLHRLRIGAWWIAVLAMVLANVIVGAVLWSTPFASFDM